MAEALTTQPPPDWSEMAPTPEVNGEITLEGEDSRPFAHPVYKQVSLTNGIINKLTKEEIRRKLDELMLDTRGHKDVLKKRLKTYYKNFQLVQAKVRKRPRPKYDLYIVIDFEATCDEFNLDDYPHEIIEFPIVLVDARKQTVIDEFHSYVKPVNNPKLTDFCTRLTGITQDQVDSAERFEQVLTRAEAWMSTHCWNNGKSCAVVTDGPWDMSRFMFLQCQTSRLLFPAWSRRWVNIRKSFCNYYRLRRAKLNLMLANLGMTFEGRPHSGLDDTRNIARIVMRMLADGAPLKLNEELYDNKREKNRAAVCPVQRGDSDEADSDDLDTNQVVYESSNHSNQVSCNHGDRSTDAGGVAELERRVEDLSVTENVDDLMAYYALQKT